MMRFDPVRLLSLLGFAVALAPLPAFAQAEKSQKKAWFLSEEGPGSGLSGGLSPLGHLRKFR